MTNVSREWHTSTVPHATSKNTLLPIAKSDVVKGKYIFTCMIEFCSLALMLVGIVAFILLTVVSYKRACVAFEKIDL